ncbi:hypothetical protein GGI07_005507 [Coemansia sp. Benny D115]|nr:hypothetical protein GGI07_005507 [Coemansia sp. Benny D115]
MPDQNRDISVVVVGGSYAGQTTARQLANLRKKGYSGLKVTLIDQNTHYYHAVGFPKALVDEDFADKVFLPFAKFFGPTSKHQFVHGRLSSIIDGNTIELESGQRIHYDYLLLATGGQSAAPIHLNGTTKEEGLEEIAQLRQALTTADSILVVGGGAVGVEISGFVGAQYPDKKVTLVHSGERLLPTNFREGVGNGAASKLKQLGVDVVLNERVEMPKDSPHAAMVGTQTLKGSSGAEYTADVVIKAIGLKVKSEFMAPLEALEGTSLRATSGPKFIRVKPTLQLDSKLFPNIFIPGDANDLPMTAKYAYKAEMQGGTAAGNVRRLIESGFDQDLANARSTSSSAAAEVPVPELSKWNDMIDAIMVPIGPDLGVVQMMKVALGCSFIPNYLVRLMKSRDFMIWMRKGYFKNAD